MKGAIGISVGLLTAIALYPLLRVGAAIWGHEANPATLLYAPHAGYFWRMWTCAYAGALVAVIAFMLAKPAHVRFLAPMLYASCALLAMQALLVP